jgi:membrane-associated phospholipid phosphatase
MNKPALFQARWDIRALLICNLIPIALLCFWLWPVGHAICTAVDERFYHLVNQPLATNTTWRYIWTVGSLRPFDIFVGLVLLTLLLRGDWVFKAGQIRQAFFGFLAILLLMVVIRAAFSAWCDTQGWQHDSISIVLGEKAVHLSDWYPHLDKKLQLKDQSDQSFPGDHASVLLIWALFMTRFTRTAGQSLLIWGVAVLFMMPRLVAGAHWGQDDYIGALLMAVLALGWGFYTPFAAMACAGLMRLTAPLFRLAGRIPGIRRMSLVGG